LTDLGVEWWKVRLPHSLTGSGRFERDLCANACWPAVKETNNLSLHLLYFHLDFKQELATTGWRSTCFAVVHRLGSQQISTQHGCRLRIIIIMSGNGAIQPSSERVAIDDFDLTCSIPMHHDPQCCCSNATCAFLRETQAAFDTLDDTIRTAGRLGQVSNRLFTFPIRLSTRMFES